MTVVDLYTIQIVLDDANASRALAVTEVRKVGAVMAEAEENMTDLLPDGYRAVIRRWNELHEDEETQDE